MTWPTWLTHNPLAWVALLNGAVDLGVAFGAPIDSPEKAAIGVFLGLISTLFVQSQVTSTTKLASMGVTISPPVATVATATVIPLPLPVPVAAPASPAPPVPPAVPPTV